MVENKSNDLFNSIIDPILVIDKNNKIIDFNNAFLSLIGKKRKNIIGKKCFEIVHGTKTPIKGCVSYKSRKTKKSESFEYYHPKFQKYLLISSNPIIEKGSVNKVVHHIRDITELRESEEKYSNMFNLCRDGFVIVNGAGKIIDANQAYINLLEYDDINDLKKINLWNLTTERYSKWEHEAKGKMLFEKGYTDVYEKEYYKKDGSIVPVELLAYVIKKGSSIDETIIAGFVRDITERKKAEQFLEQKTRYLQVTNDISNELSKNMSFDNLAKIMKEGLNLYGCHIALMNNNRIEVVSSSTNIPDLIYKRLVKKLNINLQTNTYVVEFLKNVKEIKEITYNELIHILDKEQKIKSKLAYIHSNHNLSSKFGQMLFVPLKNLGAMVITKKFGQEFSPAEKSLISNLANNVSVAIERNYSKKALKKSEDNYRSLVEYSSAGVAVANLKGSLEFVNEALCKMLGYSKEELIGKPCINFIHPEDKKNISKIFFSSFKNPKKRVYLEFRVIHKKGHTIYLSSTPTPFIHNKKIIRFNAIINDITERKKAEEQKEKLQLRLKQYAKKLEIKVKKLEKDKMNLTEKEKIVLWGITRHPNDTDLQLAKKIKIKRSTVTAIRNRLRKEGMFFVLNIPNFKALGAELVSFVYGRYNFPFEKRKEMQEKKEFGDIDINYLVSTDNEFVSGFISKNLAEFEKNIAPALSTANKHNLLKKYRIAHFLFELNKVYKFLGHSDLLKHLFEIRIKEEEKEEKEVDIKLNKNEKNVLLKMIEFPELSAYDLSFKVKLTRATVAKIKDKLIKEKAISKTVIPNMEKLGFEFLILSHIKQDTILSRNSLKSMLKQNPHFIFFVGGNREAIGLSYFKDYDRYTEFMKKEDPHNKGMVLEKPIMFKLLTMNIKSRMLDFLETTKKLLEEN